MMQEISLLCEPTFNFYMTTESFRGGSSFVDPFCYLCFMFVFIFISCQFLAALGSPAGKGLTFGPLVFCFFLVFCHFPTWCRGSGT